MSFLGNPMSILRPLTVLNIDDPSSSAFWGAGPPQQLTDGLRRGPVDK